MRPEIIAGPIWRARRLAKVRALMGSWLAPPRPPLPWGASSCAKAERETHNRSGNSFMVGVYRMAPPGTEPRALASGPPAAATSRPLADARGRAAGRGEGAQWRSSVHRNERTSAGPSGIINSNSYGQTNLDATHQRASRGAAGAHTGPATGNHHAATARQRARRQPAASAGDQGTGAGGAEPARSGISGRRDRHDAAQRGQRSREL